MKLEEYADSLAYDVAFWLQCTTNSDYPFEELGGLSLELSEKLRSLAILTLVAQGESDLFYHNLIRSGRVRSAYVDGVHTAGELDDHHFCSGRYEALLDVVAANELPLARHIIERSPREFRQDHEYEDDYCYAQILSRWIVEPPRDEEVPPLLERFAAYTEGQPNTRLSLCRALWARNQAAFDEAFADLLHGRDLEIEAAKARGQLEEPQVIAQRRVFVEGLAILRIAERRDLHTEREYRYCPSSARVPMQTPFPGE
jgi:hypothetical protein